MKPEESCCHSHPIEILSTNTDVENSQGVINDNNNHDNKVKEKKRLRTFFDLNSQVISA